MVSEHYEPVDRELQMTYSAFDYMADDQIQQKDESRKKEATNLQSIVADFKQQFLDQLIMFRRDLVEMIREETNNIRSQSGPYIEDPMKSGGSSLSYIASGGSTSNDDEVLHTPKMSLDYLKVTTVIGKEEEIHDQVSDSTSEINKANPVHFSLCDFTGETKRIPDLKVDTIVEEGGVVKEKKGSKVVGGSSDYVSNCGGNRSTQSFPSESPESKELDSSPNPDPEPPDEYFTAPKVRPNPCMGRKTAQRNHSPIASEFGLSFGPSSHLHNPEDDGTTFVHQVSAQNLINSFNASKEGSITRIRRSQDSRVWKTEFAHRELDQLSAIRLITGRHLAVDGELELMKNRSPYDPEYANFGFRSEPNPDPPDGYPPPLWVDSLRKSETNSSSTTEGETIWTLAMNRYSSSPRIVVINDNQIQPSPQVDNDMAQGSHDPVEWKHLSLLDTTSHFPTSGLVGDSTKVGNQIPINASYERLEIRYVEWEGSRNWKTEAAPLGVTIQGGILQGDVKELFLLVGIPLSMGSKTLGDILTKWINSNTIILIKNSERVSTADDQPCPLLISLDLEPVVHHFGCLEEERALEEREYTSTPLVFLLVTCQGEQNVFLYNELWTKQSAKVRKLWTKWAAMDIGFNKMATNVLKSADKFSAVKDLQYEKEVIIMKNREGIGVGHESKIKKTKYLLDLKEEDTVWFRRWTDHAKAKQGIGLLHQFQVVGVYMWDKYICKQGNLDEFESWQNYESGTLAEKHWTPTLILEGIRKPTCKGSTSRAVGGGDIVTGLLPFFLLENQLTSTLILKEKGDWKLNGKGLTLTAVGWGYVIGLLQFHYFFYPP